MNKYDEHKKLARSPRVWKVYGCRLSYSADAIMAVVKAGFFANVPTDVKVPGRLHVAQMLYGLALENGLKARILEKKPGLLKIAPKKNSKSGEPRLEWTGLADGHDLVMLADATDFIEEFGKSPEAGDSVSQEHLRNLLEHLSACIRWIARYPVPKNWLNLSEPEDASFSRNDPIRNIDHIVTPMLEFLLYENGEPVWRVDLDEILNS